MADLYDFQKGAVAQLMAGKHIIVAGCLAEGTPVPLSDGQIKLVEDIQVGDKLMSYDEVTKELVANPVGQVFRSSQNLRPMIQLTHEREKIITTYDHPFFNGDGYYPLYQLVWGALEASQRVQLKLLCEQYGQDIVYEVSQCQEGRSHAPSSRQKWVLQDSDGWEDSQSPQNSSRELARKSQQIAFCEPYKLHYDRQPSGELRVLHPEIQCLVVDEKGENTTATTPSQYSTHEPGERVGENSISTSRKETWALPGRQLSKGEVLRRYVQEVSRHGKSVNKRLGKWEVEILPPRPYYTISMQRAPYTYCIGREHYYLTHNCGSGKNPMSMVWAAHKCEETGKNKIVVVTTASKAKLTDHWDDLCAFCPSFSNSLSSFSLLSWHKLRAWVDANWRSLGEYVYVFDEIQRAKAGVSSGMGRAFLKITKRTEDWAGFTGTPGDTWLSFYPYLQACDLVRNKTTFLNTYASMQTYKGYPEIIGWRNEERLKDMWASISYAPDTSKVMAELPDQTHKVVEFKKQPSYNKILKTRTNEDGEFLDTAAAMCAELRRQCFTKDKQEWVKDFVEGLESGCVFFYNFIKTGDTLEEIMQKALPKDAKIWRIDGKHHDIPTADTIGPKDMVLCQWQSGSEALNLQYLHYWCSVEACYSYSTSIQARGRIRRIGQRMPQFYYYLKTTNTIEDDVYKALANKSDFAESNWCVDNNITEE